jgi:predicted translin family RNA/ssDNA-binding protein
MPSPPYQYRSAESTTFNLSSVGSQISQIEERRRIAYDMSHKLQIRFVKARSEMEMDSFTPTTTSQTLHEISSSLQELVGSASDRTPRDGNLTNRVEELVCLLAFNHFLATGTLLSPSECGTFVTDEEYLAGACMSLCQTLSRYAIGRATARDLASVQATRDLVQQILDYLLTFDFRNGYLRHKYDGTKYALKTLETLLYELSVTGAADTEESDTKAERRVLLNQEELEGIRARMAHRDELRENLIKKSRDGQKAAKQAIYALHRGDSDGARKLLNQCEDCINNHLFPIVNEEPPLRTGSHTQVVEEYVEAKLFYTWLHGNADLPLLQKPSGILLMPQDFSLPLQMDEYLGGLCDLTGEIGRYAVQRGTARDFDGVKLCLATNTAIYLAMQTLERLPGGIGKKMDQLRQSVEKLERMTYELSLSEATGRKIAMTDQ